MIQRVISLVGISGVGKSTFLKNALQEIDFQHLTAGSLIASAVKSGFDRDQLRLQNVDWNQHLLLEGMRLNKSPSAELILIDGHAVVDGEHGVVSVGYEVFLGLGVCGIIHLEAEPANIKRNRERDLSRQRPNLSTEELARQQELSLQTALQIADTLCVPFLRVANDMSAFVSFVQSVGLAEGR